MGRRFFRYGELPLVLLALVEQRSLGAYELMRELERLFAPDYRPSPGGVYPALHALAEEGLVEAVAGPSTQYHCSSKGRQALASRRGELAAIEHRTGRHLGGDSDLDRVLAQMGARVRAVAGRLSPHLVEEELDRAVRRLETEADTTVGART